MANEKEVSEEEVLFDNIEIQGEVIKPWSFGKLFDISGSLEVILDKAEEKGLIDVVNTGYFTYTDMAKMFLLFRDELLKIISLTLDKEESEIREFSVEKGVKIALGIFNQNKEVLKNALAPLLSLEGIKEVSVEDLEKEVEEVEKAQETTS